jgi:hypothetical protein
MTPSEIILLDYITIPRLARLTMEFTTPLYVHIEMTKTTQDGEVDYDVEKLTYERQTIEDCHDKYCIMSSLTTFHDDKSLAIDFHDVIASKSVSSWAKMCLVFTLPVKIRSKWLVGMIHHYTLVHKACHPHKNSEV